MNDLASMLDDLTNDKRRFGVFAIDHRDSLRAFVRPDDPDSLTAQEINEKLKIPMEQAEELVFMADIDRFEVVGAESKDDANDTIDMHEFYRLILDFSQYHQQD